MALWLFSRRYEGKEGGSIHARKPRKAKDVDKLRRKQEDVGKPSIPELGVTAQTLLAKRQDSTLRLL